MAKLINCKACGAKVSKNAPTCPGCGEPVKKKSNEDGCWALIILGIFVFFIYLAMSEDGNEESQIPLTAAEQRAQQIESQFSAWDGAHHHLERLVKANLKDPDSYQHIKTTYRDSGSDAILVEMHYRAKNSFGGYVVDRAVAIYTLAGQPVGEPSLSE